MGANRHKKLENFGFNNFLISPEKDSTLNSWRAIEIYIFYSGKIIGFKNIT